MSGEKRNLGLVNIFSTFSSSTSFKININTASLEQLLLLEGMDVATARAIIRERQVRRFEDPTDRLPEFKHYEVWSKDIMVRKGMGAQFYTIKSRGFVGSVTREINCTVLVSKNNFLPKFQILNGRKGFIFWSFESKYPPAKPGALRLQAPQRRLTAIGQNQNRENIDVQSITKVFILVIPAKAGIQFLPDSGSRFTCPE